MKNILILAFMFVLLSIKYVNANDENLKLKDSDFTKKNYESSIYLIEGYLPKMLRRAKNPQKLLNNSEFWISYYNSLIYIKGYTLKKEAEAEKRFFNRKKYKVAHKKYLEFLDSTELSD